MIFFASGNVKPAKVMRFLEKAFADVSGTAPATNGASPHPSSTWCSGEKGARAGPPAPRQPRFPAAVRQPLRRGDVQHDPRRRHVLPAFPEDPREGRPRLQRRLVSQRLPQRRIPGRLRGDEPEEPPPRDRPRTEGNASDQARRSHCRRARERETVAEGVDSPLARVDREPDVRASRVRSTTSASSSRPTTSSKTSKA